MEVWGLDPDHCVLGETEHPFTSGFWHGDVRITTHYMPQDMFSNLYSVAHEGGHALYELNVDPKYDYTILAQPPACTKARAACLKTMWAAAARSSTICIPLCWSCSPSS